jgi:hypothetical protein
VFYWFDPRVNPPPPPADIVVVQRWDLSVVVSGSPWPFPDNLSSGAASFSGIESTVQNGVGFIGGILRRQAMYESCELVNRPASVTHCELIYDSRSALLEGHVSYPAGFAAGRYEDLAFVTLSELDGNRVRPVRADFGGYFRFGALEPGRGYRLRIERPGFVSFEETFTMSLAERRNRDIMLNR